MRYDTQLAQHIRQILVHQPAVTEKVMFGGIVFMVNGHIACGVVGDEVLVRIGVERYISTVQMAHVRPFQMGKRQSRGWVLVGTQALRSADDLHTWVQQGITSALALSAKEY